MKLGISKTKSPDKIDFLLLTFLVLMALMSVLAIYSTFALIGNAAGWDLLIKQSMWFIIGFIAIGIIMYLGNDSMLQFAKIAYWILMGCLLYLLLNKFAFTLLGRTLPFSDPVNGAFSWFQFKSLGSFQPSEFMKIVLILITAGIIDEHNKTKISDSYEMDFKLFLSIAKWVIPPAILIFLQPDTGVVLIIGISILAMLLCSGIRREWIIALVMIIVCSIIFFLYMYYFHFDTLNNLIGGDNGYKMNRITSWLNPETDINDSGHQLYVALLAIGSAGLQGHGMNLNLIAIPEAPTDFIFAIIGQSWGLIGTLFVVILCFALDARLCKIAIQCQNMFEKYFILGILGMLLYQQVQNTSMICGLLPITGITLPLISYGGSSLLSYLAAFGIIMNASAKNKKNEHFTYHGLN